MKNRFIRLSCFVLALALLGLAAAAVQNQNVISQKQNVPKLCSDIVAHLTVQKNPDGTVVLTGRICNDGPGAYSNPSGHLDAFFMVYTWHPPKTPAQEGDLKLFNHTDLGATLKFRDCKSVTYTHKIDKFSRWGTFPASATERPAMKQFCVRVEKMGTQGFSPCEDSNNTNTTQCQDVAYMEKI